MAFGNNLDVGSIEAIDYRPSRSTSGHMLLYLTSDAADWYGTKVEHGASMIKNQFTAQLKSHHLFNFCGIRARVSMGYLS